MACQAMRYLHSALFLTVLGDRDDEPDVVET
jgi:hypothetical protein